LTTKIHSLRVFKLTLRAFHYYAFPYAFKQFEWCEGNWGLSLGKYLIKDSMSITQIPTHCGLIYEAIFADIPYITKILEPKKLRIYNQEKGST